MRNAMLGAAWNTWRGIAVELKQQEIKLSAAVHRMRKHHLSMAFKKWKATAVQMKAEQLMMQRARCDL